MYACYAFYFYFFNPYLRIFRERGKEMEREKHQSVASCMHPQPGIKPATYPQPRYVS